MPGELSHPSKYAHLGNQVVLDQRPAPGRYGGSGLFFRQSLAGNAGAARPEKT